MRLAFLLELVLAVGVGLALARANGDDPSLFIPAGWARTVVHVCHTGGHVLAGIGLVVGLGTWIEAARRRGPKPWGPGRWVWSVTAGALLWAAAWWVVQYAWAATRPGDRSALIGPLVEALTDLPGDEFFVPATGFLVAVALTHRFAGVARGPAADGREWAGRIYVALLAATVVVSSVAWNLSGRSGMGGQG